MRFCLSRRHEAERLEQEARGKLERQRITDQAQAEKARKELLELEALRWVHQNRVRTDRTHEPQEPKCTHHAFHLHDETRFCGFMAEKNIEKFWRVGSVGLQLKRVTRFIKT